MTESGEEIYEEEVPRMDARHPGMDTRTRLRREHAPVVWAAQERGPRRGVEQAPIRQHTRRVVSPALLRYP
jgi:hypothetical protein